MTLHTSFPRRECDTGIFIAKGEAPTPAKKWIHQLYQHEGEDSIHWMSWIPLRGTRRRVWGLWLWEQMQWAGCKGRWQRWQRKGPQQRGVQRTTLTHTNGKTHHVPQVETSLVEGMGQHMRTMNQGGEKVEAASSRGGATCMHITVDPTNAGGNTTKMGVCPEKGHTAIPIWGDVCPAHARHATIVLTTPTYQRQQLPCKHATHT